MKIAFWGTSEFVGSVQKARFLRRLVGAGLRPAAVVTAPDVPVRGGGEPIPLAVKSAALEFGLPLLQPRTLDGFSGELKKLEIELSLVVAYGKILPPEVLAVPKFGSLNAHPSLLPRWRGPTPIQATILAGDLMSGATIIKMDEKMDHGPIVARREFPLSDYLWTAPELSDALTDIGVEVLLGTLEPWILGKITPQEQKHAEATYSRILKREDGRIDWSKSSQEIERMIRAFQPWPGAYTFWQDGGVKVRLAIEEASVEHLESSFPRPRPRRSEGGLNLERGKVLAQHGNLVIRSGDGTLLIRRLRPEGGRSITGQEFLRGHAQINGATLS